MGKGRQGGKDNDYPEQRRQDIIADCGTADRIGNGGQGNHREQEYGINGRLGTELLYKVFFK